MHWLFQIGGYVLSKIWVVGIGPGAYELMTVKAAEVLKNCDVIIGYTVYVDLVKEHFAGKEFLTTPMKKEVDRCVMAFEEAKKGKKVAMICSGDAGVYGMAGLMYEVGVNYPEVELEIVSGGATSSFTLVHWGTMPEGINHLRIGEGILVAKDLQVDWGIHDMDYLRMDCMTLRAQIVEVKDKPTHPVGPIMVDCFCSRPTYEDRGIRRRAIAGIGRADVGDIMMLHPRTPGMTVVGGSSDHCILDVEDCDPCPQVGDIVDFDVIYLTMLYASAREDVAVKFVD